MTFTIAAHTASTLIALRLLVGAIKTHEAGEEVLFQSGRGQLLPTLDTHYEVLMQNLFWEVGVSTGYAFRVWKM